MRSLSNIIKGGRIRKETMIDFSERYIAMHAQESDAELALEQTEEEKAFSIYEEKLNEANEKATQILMEANQKAEQILQEALTNAAHIEEKAKNSEIEMHARMDEEKRKLLENTNNECARLLEEAQNEKTRIINESEGEIVETLKHLLQYIVSEELFNHTEWLECIVKRVLSDERLRDPITVLVSPNLYERLSDIEKQSIERLRKEIVLQEADELNDTSCKVITSEGCVEYDLNEGLNRVLSEIQILSHVK